MTGILRRSYTLSTLLLAFLLAHEQPLLAFAASQNNNNNKPVCKVLEACRRCTDGDKGSISECQATGKILVRRCTSGSEDEQSAKTPDQQQQRSGLEYISCARTKSEEEFLLVRLQVLWLLVGILAFWSVQKQRLQTSSLFDQRKQRRSDAAGITSTPMTTPSDNLMDDGSTAQHDVDHVELASMSSLSTFASKEETTPLTARIPSNLEII